LALTVALDTKRLSDLLRGDTGLIHWLEESERIYVPFVLGEVRAGFRGGSQALKNEVLLARFLAKPGVHLLLPDAATADAYASLKTELRGAGTPIRANDLWIAALCLQHHLPLVTRDAHFARIPQLLRL